MLLALQGGIKIEAKTQFLMDKIIEKMNSSFQILRWF
jgi:hypothetical protein